MENDSGVRILIAIVLGIILIASGLTGLPGSIIGSLVDTQAMIEG